MNLHRIVSGAIAAVNPHSELTVQISDGYAIGAGGVRTPQYQPPMSAFGQVQPLETGDIAKLDGVAIQGVRRKIYINGQIDGLVRPDKKGGDLITTQADGRKWLVVAVLEAWPNWTCVAVTLQMS